MLSISEPRTASAATAYYLHLEKDSLGKIGEYYAKEDAAGRWMGAGARTLGLDGDVRAADFAALCQGFDQNHRALARNAGQDSRRAGWDLTFSAPKSVSVIWSICDESTRSKIEAAHHTAVETSFAFLQGKAGFARTGAQGQRLEHGDLIAAAFQHGTSREQDAQLHTHVFLMNAVMRADGKAASVSSEKLYEYKMAAGAAYQCSLAYELGKLGYRLERDGEQTFRVARVPKALESEHSTRRQQIEAEMVRTGGSGAKAAALATLVTRTAKREVDLPALREKWISQARSHHFSPEQARPDRIPSTAQPPLPSHAITKALNHDHYRRTHSQQFEPASQRSSYGLPERYFRAPAPIGHLECLGRLRTFDRLHTVPQRSVDDQHQRVEMLLSRHAPHQLEHLRAASPDRLRRDGARHLAGTDLGKVSLDGASLPPTVAQILDKATQHDAIVHDALIQMHAFRAAIGCASPQDASVLAEHAKGKAIAVERLDGRTDRRGQAYTTPELIKAERDIVRIAVERQGDRSHILDHTTLHAAVQTSALAKGYALNSEQCAALDRIAGQGGAVAVLVGDAGTGKSTTMYALREAYEQAGFRVIGTSTGGKQSAELMQSAGIDSRNLRQLEHDLQRGHDRLDARTVVVLDEAGMTDSRQMAMLMRSAAAADAKVVLVGDHKQLQPVGAGETFRHLAEELGAARLQDNQRQRADWERGAVKQMSQGEAQAALAAYVHNDRVTVEKTFEKAVADVAKRQLDNIRLVGAENTVAIASTNVTIHAINVAIRQALKDRGQLQDATNIVTKRGQIELAPGDRVVIGTAGRRLGFENGDACTVQGIGDKGQVTVKLDRTGAAIVLHADKVDLSHGYAITTHKSQGTTYERATVYLTAQTSREMAYVQSSRARDLTHFVTSSHQLKTMGAQVSAPLELRESVDKVAMLRVTAGKDVGLVEDTKETYAKAIAYLQKNQNFAPEIAKAVTDKEQLLQLAQAMSKEKPKASTLDYRLSLNDSKPDQPIRDFSAGKGMEQQFKDSLKQLDQALERKTSERESPSRGNTNLGLDS